MNVYKRIRFYCDDCQNTVENIEVKQSEHYENLTEFYCKDCGRLLMIIDDTELFIEGCYKKGDIKIG